MNIQKGKGMELPSPSLTVQVTTDIRTWEALSCKSVLV